MSDVIAEPKEVDRDDVLRPLREADRALAEVVPYLIAHDDPDSGITGLEVAYALLRLRLAKNNLETTIRCHTGSDPEGGQE